MRYRGFRDGVRVRHWYLVWDTVVTSLCWRAKPMKLWLWSLCRLGSGWNDGAALALLSDFGSPFHM